MKNYCARFSAVIHTSCPLDVSASLFYLALLFSSKYLEICAPTGETCLFLMTAWFRVF